MNELNSGRTKPDKSPPPLIEGRDFYFEHGLLVLTARYLTERGYCCSNGCRNCPYDEDGKLEQIDL